MKSLLIAILLMVMMGMVGCGTVAKFDVKASQDFYEAFKASAEQNKISLPIRIGCWEGWGGFSPSPTPTVTSPVIVQSLQELANLVSTSGTSVQIAAIKERFGTGWNQADYDLGYIYCAQAKLGIQAGVQEAQAALPIILKIIGMFQ